MSRSEVVVAALARRQQEHSDANLAWIRSGLFGAAYPALLVETYHYVKHSIALLARACSLLTGRTDLQRYLIKHMLEEVGHEEWALEDLQVLGIERGAAIASSPLQETVSLVGTQYFLIEQVSPIAILGYIYTMESMPPDDGIIRELTECYNIPEGATKFLLGHAAADVSHRAELLEVLDNSIRDTKEEGVVVTAAVAAVEGLTRMLGRIRSGDFLRA